MAGVEQDALSASALDGQGDEEKARARADELGLPYEPLDATPTNPDLWGEVPLELLVRYSCVPVGHEGERIVLAFGALEDPAALDELEFLLERPVEAVIAPARRVESLLKRHRGGEILLERASEGLRLQFVDEDEEDVDVKTLPAETAGPPTSTSRPRTGRSWSSTGSTGCSTPRSSLSTRGTTRRSSAGSR
jgi:hypothetical protein